MDGELEELHAKMGKIRLAVEASSVELEACKEECQKYNRKISKNRLESLELDKKKNEVLDATLNIKQRNVSVFALT